MAELERIQQDFEKKYGNALILDFHQEHGGLGITLKVKYYTSTFITVTLRGTEAYIDMLNVEVKGAGYGTLLMQSLIALIKQLGGKTLTGHLTNNLVLKILEHNYDARHMKLFAWQLGSFGKEISFQEAEQRADNEGFFISVHL